VVIGEGAGADPGMPRQRNRSLQGAGAVAGSGPRVRLLLNGVVDATGSRVTSSNSQLVVDALVSPSTAVTGAPPFIFPLDINGGLAFLDVSLPVAPQGNASVRLQILGVTVLDPEGQPFAVLGFELAPVPATPLPETTPTPTSTPDAEGRCFKGSDCGGASVPASQEACCRLEPQPAQGTSGGGFWCPPDAFDAATGQCATAGCIACWPAPTPTPEPCANLTTCGGPCNRTCGDGTIVAGQCAGQAGGGCECSALCTSPTPCGIGECFDSVTQHCTGQPCDSTLRCSLPNQICDVGGLRCPCRPAPPPLPHGQICCQCKDRTPACFDFSFVEVQPICPPGCETFIGKECAAAIDSCVALTPCASDKDCNDGNPCTIDRCTATGCAHDCICVGPAGCGPGPARHTPR
jgi:hypothetical protein